MQLKQSPNKVLSDRDTYAIFLSKNELSCAVLETGLKSVLFFFCCRLPGLHLGLRTFRTRSNMSCWILHLDWREKRTWKNTKKREGLKTASAKSERITQLVIISTILLWHHFKNRGQSFKKLMCSGHPGSLPKGGGDWGHLPLLNF